MAAQSGFQFESGKLVVTKGPGNPDVAFELPSDREGKRWRVSFREGTGARHKFVVVVMKGWDEELGQNVVRRAFLSVPVLLHYDDVAERSGPLPEDHFEELDEEVNFDEVLGDHWSGRWEPSNKTPRYRRSYRPAIASIQNLWGSALVVTAPTQEEAREIYMDTFGILSVSGSERKLFTVTESTGDTFPITPSNQSRSPKKASRAKRSKRAGAAK